jgi:hypothetical protein
MEYDSYSRFIGTRPVTYTYTGSCMRLRILGGTFASPNTSMADSIWSLLPSHLLFIGRPRPQTGCYFTAIEQEAPFDIRSTAVQ